MENNHKLTQIRHILGVAVQDIEPKGTVLPKDDKPKHMCCVLVKE